MPRISARHESLPLTAPFRISRGVKTAAEVVVVEAEQDGVAGRGEAVPYARYGETVESVLDTAVYPPGRKISDEEMATIQLQRDEFHGEWNYTISPRAVSSEMIIL